MNKLLKKLTEAVGVSSDEGAIRQLIKDEIENHVDSWEIDPLGNLIAWKKGTQNDTTVMIDAHMDEVGLMITGLDGNGTLKFSPVGGFDDRSLLGKVVQVGPKKITGVIGSQPIHLASAVERQKIVPRKNMRIDIGATSKTAADEKVKVGDLVAFLTPYEEQGSVALGKAFDDRAGCLVVIELLKRGPYPFNLAASFTVQEEVGLRGAHAAAARIRPDVAFIFDCTPAYDLPTPPDIDESPNVRLGKGPALYVMDRASIQDPRLVSHLLKTADQHDIPVQIRRPGGGGTNTASIQRSGPGVISATIGLPGRYLHAPTSMISLSDLAHVIDLAEKGLKELKLEQLTD